MQRSIGKQPRRTAGIPFQTARLEPLRQPSIITVLPSRLDEDCQEFDECQYACHRTPPGHSSRPVGPVRQMLDKHNPLSCANPIGSDNPAAMRVIVLFSPGMHF